MKHINAVTPAEVFGAAKWMARDICETYNVNKVTPKLLKKAYKNTKFNSSYSNLVALEQLNFQMHSPHSIYIDAIESSYVKAWAKEASPNDNVLTYKELKENRAKHGDITRDIEIDGESFWVYSDTWQTLRLMMGDPEVPKNKFQYTQQKTENKLGNAAINAFFKGYFTFVCDSFSSLFSLLKKT